MLNSILFFYILIVGNIYADFREIKPLESENFFETSQDKKKESLEKQPKKAKVINKNKAEKDISEVVHVKDSENVKEVIEKNSVTVITEEKLKEIISLANNSPLPENSVESNGKVILNSNTNNSQPDFFIDIQKTLDKYSFSDKSEDMYGGQVTSKEITSDKIIDNLEFGVGVAYKNDEYYESQYESKNSDVWTHTPIYATGKYKLSSNEESTKYLKLNLGYAIGEYEDNEKYMDKRNQSGVYYGVGGGVEYDDVSLDLIYQVNKDAYEKNNSTQDDSRITFSIDYKLNF